MADINHTRIPNLSIDSMDGSGASTPRLDVTSRASLIVGAVAAFSGAESHSGAATFSGTLNVSSAVTLGANGVGFAGLRSSTVSVALGTVASDSITTSLTIPNIAVGDPVVAIVPASIWSGAYRDISLSGYASADSTVLLGAVNSTITGINTAAMNMTLYWLDLA